METVLIVVAGIGAFVATILSRLLADEFNAWQPKLTGMIIESATRRLPEELRDRYREEWLADIEQYPGCITKLWRATRCLIGAPNLVEILPANSAKVQELRPTKNTRLCEPTEKLSSRFIRLSSPVKLTFILSKELEVSLINLAKEYDLKNLKKPRK